MKQQFNEILLEYYNFVLRCRYYSRKGPAVVLSISGIGFAEEFFEFLEVFEEERDNNDFFRFYEEYGGIMWKCASLCQIYERDFVNFINSLKEDNFEGEKYFISKVKTYLGHTKKVLREYYSKDVPILENKLKIEEIFNCMYYLMLYGYIKFKEIKNLSIKELIENSIKYNKDQLEHRHGTKL